MLEYLIQQEFVLEVTEMVRYDSVDVKVKPVSDDFGDVEITVDFGEKEDILGESFHVEGIILGMEAAVRSILK